MTDFTFLYLADTQLGCYATFSGMTDADIADFAERNMRVRAVPKVEGWEWDAARYRDAVSVANDLSPDFVILGGDMINNIGDLGQLEAFDAVTGQLDDSIPLHFVPGNHDISYDANSPSTSSVETYREIFGPDYYAFEHKDAAVVVIDSVVFDVPDAIPDLYEEQLSWIDRTLDDTDSLSGPTIVISHHPLFLETPDEPDQYWNLPVAQRRLLFDVFSGHDIATVFHGHLHRNMNTTHGGIEYVTSSAVGYPLGEDPSGYRVVHVSDDTVTHRYHGFDDQGWIDT